jgi:hypothetical protein
VVYYSSVLIKEGAMKKEGKYPSSVSSFVADKLSVDEKVVVKINPNLGLTNAKKASAK